MARDDEITERTAPPGRAEIQPSVRVSTAWSPDLIRSAIYSADGGSMRLIGDLVDQVMADDRMQTVLQARIDALLGLDLHFHEGPARPRKKTRTQGEPSDIVKALDEGGDYWRMSPEDQQRQIMGWAWVLGFSLAQLKYEENSEGRLLPCFEFWHPKNTRWSNSERTWLARVENHQEIRIDPGDGQWFMFQPYGRFRPWAHGLWRGLALWWLLKQYARDDWARHGEVAALRVATSPESSTRPHRQELSAAMYALGRDASIVLPPGYDMNLVEAKADTEKIYKAQIAMADEAMAIAVLGNNLTTKVEGGSFAATKEHSAGQAKRIRSDDEQWSTVQRQQQLRWYANFNFLDPEAAPWPIRDTDPPEDLKAGAETLKLVSEAALNFNELGFRIDPEWLSDKFKVPLIENEEPEPQEPGPQVPPPEQPPPQQLGSGFDVKNAAGFVEGQQYADSLIDNADTSGVDAFLAKLFKAVDGIDDLETARARMLEFYEDANIPDDVVDQLEKLLSMAELGGRAAVRQDTPELSE